jgi:PhoH-like ATPase
MNHAQGMKDPGKLVIPRAKGLPPTKQPKSRKGASSKHVKQSIPTNLRRIKTDDVRTITYVLDTNVIMTTWEALFKFEEHDVCIVGQVWAELDKHKTGPSTKAWNVRQAIRTIDELLVGKTKTDILEGIRLTPPAELLNGKEHTGKLFFDFSQPSLPLEQDIMLDLGHPDDRIIAICLALKKAGKRVVLVSNDGSCRVKATVAGVDAEEYLSDTAGDTPSEEVASPGFRKLPFAFEDSEILDCKDLGDGRMGYEFKSDQLSDVACNEFLIPKDIEETLRVTSIISPGHIKAESLNFLDLIKDSGIEARNLEQELALQLLFDDNLTAVSIGGRAGSGKTYLTIAVAIYLVKNGPYERIIFTRSAHGDDEDPGFLKGNLDEKMEPWMGALWDNLQSLHKKKKGGSNAEEDEGTKKILSDIETPSLHFMKGRSITNTLIIVDESPDLTPSVLKMICTRVGEGSKLVLLGNVDQISNPMLTKHTNGLSKFIRSFKPSNLTGHVTLQSGVRSPFATLAEASL